MTNGAFYFYHPDGSIWAQKTNERCGRTWFVGAQQYMGSWKTPSSASETAANQESAAGASSSAPEDAKPPERRPA